MEERFPLNDLSSKDHKILWNALKTVENALSQDHISVSDANALFFLIYPNLSNKFIRIRLISFNIIDKLLSDFSNSLIQPILILPICLSSLIISSKSQSPLYSQKNAQTSHSPSRASKIYDLSKSCLSKIIEICSLNEWWKDCQQILFNSKSIQQRQTLLEILRDHCNDLPLIPMIQLLDDPYIQISSIAYEIIQSADPQKLKKALDNANQSKKQDEKISDKIAKLYDLIENYQKPSNPPQCKNNLSSEMSYIQEIDDEIIQPIEEDSEVEKLNEDEKSFGNSILDDISSIDEEENFCIQKPAQITSKIHNKHIEEEEEEKDILIYDPENGFTLNGNQVQIDNSNEDQHCSLSSVMPDFSSFENDFKLRDMHSMTFKQRCNYVKELGKIIVNSTLLPYPADQIMDCALTGVNPHMRQITPYFAKLFVDLISRHPEIIIPSAKELTSFLLSARNTKYPFNHSKNSYHRALPSEKQGSTISEKSDKLETKNETLSPDQIERIFNELEDTLISEADSYILIDASLEMPTSTRIESFLLHIYENDDRIFDKSIIQHTLDRVFSVLTLPNNHEAKQLITLIAERQPNDYLDWGARQTTAVRKMASPFIQHKKTPQKSDFSNSSKSTLSSTLSFKSTPKKEKPQIFNGYMDAFLKEIKKGNKADLKLLSSAMEHMEINGSSIEHRVFLKVINFCGKVKKDFFDNNQEYFQKLCNSRFDNPRIMDILGNTLTPNQVAGLSRFVWLCNKGILLECNRYYNNLYEQFCCSEGTTRNNYLLLFMALQFATGKSIADLSTINPRHAQVIREMIESYTKK